MNQSINRFWCPKCDSFAQARSGRTRWLKGVMRRERECTSCGYEFVTYESEADPRSLSTQQQIDKVKARIAEINKDVQSW